MSHRIKRFAAFAIFALFYHFVAVDSILASVDTKVDPKTITATTRSSLPEENVLVSTFPGHRAKVSSSFGSLRQRRTLELRLVTRHYAPHRGGSDVRVKSLRWLMIPNSACR